MYTLHDISKCHRLLLLLLLLLLLATMTLNQVQSFRINHQAGSHYINI